MDGCMELYKKILTDRMNEYREKWEKDMRPQDYHSYKSYENALIMLEYAVNGDFDCLAQFDYFGEED